MPDFDHLTLLDWEQTIALADGDAELAKDILVLTARILPADSEEIAAAFKQNNGREIRRLLHKLEGGISYAKFPRLETITFTLHGAVKNEEAEQFTELHEQLQQTIRDTIQAIEQQISK